MSRRLISKLAHISVTSPKPQESVDFYDNVLGLEVSGRDGQSVFFRGWGEHYRHSLEVAEGPYAALRLIGWRAEGPEELEIAVKRIQETGNGIGWVNGGFGRGAAYRYRGPGGHLHEIFWEVERYKATPELAPIYPNRPQRYVPRGAALREIDHVTVATQNVMGDVEWFRNMLGHRFMEYIKLPDGQVVFAMTTTGERGHDMAFVPDKPGNFGRVNHIAFWVDQRQELYRVADVLLDMGVGIEFGPGRHGLGEQEYLYIREPSGLRVEINAGGYRMADPDWEPVSWTIDQGANVLYKNQAMPQSMFEGFPAEGGPGVDGVLKDSGFFV